MTCPNCNVQEVDVEAGHSYQVTGDGLEYDVEHLGSLGMIEENGIRLMFDRMHNRLVVERIPHDVDVTITDT